MPHNPKRLELFTSQVYAIGETMRLNGHVWTITAAKDRPEEAERWKYTMERRAA